MVFKRQPNPQKVTFLDQLTFDGLPKYPNEFGCKSPHPIHKSWSGHWDFKIYITLCIYTNQSPQGDVIPKEYILGPHDSFHYYDDPFGKKKDYVWVETYRHHFPTISF